LQRGRLANSSIPWLDHTFNAKHSIFKLVNGHQTTLRDTASGGLPIFPGFPNTVDTFYARNLAIAWRWALAQPAASELSWA
jgi:hypothetical protein